MRTRATGHRAALNGSVLISTATTGQTALKCVLVTEDTGSRRRTFIVMVKPPRKYTSCGYAIFFLSLTTKEVMRYLRSMCVSVCLFVCQYGESKSRERISMKFSIWIAT